MRSLLDALFGARREAPSAAVRLLDRFDPAAVEGRVALPPLPPPTETRNVTGISSTVPTATSSHGRAGSVTAKRTVSGARATSASR